MKTRRVQLAWVIAGLLATRGAAGLLVTVKLVTALGKAEVNMELVAGWAAK